MNALLKHKGIGAPTTYYSFTGKQMNQVYRLKGKTAYPKDIHFLAFKLEGLDVAKLSIFKIQAQDRWFDDIVDNNRRHMGYPGAEYTEGDDGSTVIDDLNDLDIFYSCLA